jgi:hypothetical protein
MTSPSSASRRDLRAAWWSLLLVVPCFFLSFAIGEGIISLLGFEVGESVTPPFWGGRRCRSPRRPGLRTSHDPDLALRQPRP